MKEKVKVAGGQGFWGDLLTAPVEQMRGGAIDYLMLDYLAEVTMSILQKQKSRDPNASYAKDFVGLMSEILPDCVERNIKVTANAGGVNVEGCAEAVRVCLNLKGKIENRASGSLNLVLQGFLIKNQVFEEFPVNCQNYRQNAPFVLFCLNNQFA